MLTKQQENGIQFWHFRDPASYNAIGPEFLKSWRKMIEGVLADMQAAKGAQAAPKTKAILFYPQPCEAKNKQTIALSGGHLKQLARLKQTQLPEFFNGIREVNRMLRQLAIPTAVLLDGLVMGGGMELSLFFDIRLITQRTSFYLKQMKIGLPTGFGGETPLVESIGQSNALFHLLNESALDAQQLLDFGMAQSLEKSPENLSDVVKIGSKLFKHDVDALMAQKSLLTKTAHPPTNEEKKLTDIFLGCWRRGKHLDFISKYDVQK